MPPTLISVENVLGFVDFLKPLSFVVKTFLLVVYLYMVDPQKIKLYCFHTMYLFCSFYGIQ